MPTIETINVGTSANDWTWDLLRNWLIKANNNFAKINMDSVIVVKTASDLSWTLDSTKLYLIDWVIDMWTTQITIPQWGLQLWGNWFNISKLTSSEDSYTMFIDDWVYSWDFLFEELSIEVTGNFSKVFDIDNAWNFWAFEFSIVNFNNCTSLGSISNYRQWLETWTGRFWWKPSLTFNWTWAWGYRCTTSIVRSLDAWMTDALFKEWTWLTFGSRFLTDINCDIPALAPFCDFQSSNFINPSTLQIEWAILSRDWVINANDLNILPNITNADIASSFRNNQWINNTYVGWENTITTEVATTIGWVGTFTTLLWTFTSSNLQHFDSPSNGQLRHLWNNPREFRFIWDMNIDWGANKDLSLRLRKWDNSSSTFETVYTQRRQVNNFSWGRDVAFFTLLTNVILDQNDYVFLEVANNTDTTSVTAELSSFFLVQER